MRKRVALFLSYRSSYATVRALNITRLSTEPIQSNQYLFLKILDSYILYKIHRIVLYRNSLNKLLRGEPICLSRKYLFVCCTFLLCRIAVAPAFLSIWYRINAREIGTGLICTSNCLNFSTAIYIFDRIRF